MDQPNTYQDRGRDAEGRITRDRQLFARIGAGDKGAYTTLFELYYDHVYAKALMIGKIPAAAKDIAQQVFLNVWEKRATLESVDNPEHWLLVMARNLVLNTLKRNSRDEQYLVYLREYFEEVQASPEHAVVRQEQAELIARGLDKLTVKQREVYLLRRDQGMTYQQIADHLGISRDTAKEHGEKAIARIKAFLGEHLDELGVLVALFLEQIIIS